MLKFRIDRCINGFFHKISIKLSDHRFLSPFSFCIGNTLLIESISQQKMGDKVLDKEKVTI